MCHLLNCICFLLTNMLHLTRCIFTNNILARMSMMYKRFYQSNCPVLVHGCQHHRKNPRSPSYAQWQNSQLVSIEVEKEKKRKNEAVLWTNSKPLSFNWCTFSKKLSNMTRRSVGLVSHTLYITNLHLMWCSLKIHGKLNVLRSLPNICQQHLCLCICPWDWFIQQAIKHYLSW